MKIDPGIFRDLCVNRPQERCIIRSRSFYKGLADMLAYMDSDFELCLESGSFMFESTEFLARAFKRVISVDTFELLKECLYSPDYTLSFKLGESGYQSFDVGEKSFSAMLNTLHKLPNIETHFCSSLTLAPLIEDGSLSFAYLDASHLRKHFEPELETYIPKVKPGGYIGGHDYDQKMWPDVVAVVDEKFGKSDRVKVFSDTSWIVRI